MKGFIKIPIFLINRKMQSLDIPCEDLDATLNVRPDNIIAYNGTLDDKGNDQTMVYLSSGDSFLCGYTVKEFEEILAEASKTTVKAKALVKEKDIYKNGYM